MTWKPRTLVLAFGPPTLVALSYWLASPAGSASTLTSRSLRTGESSQHHTALAPPELAEWRWPEATTPLELATLCERAATRLQAISPEFSVFTQSPFVIAGDLPATDLNRCYRETIAPLVRAQFIEYFDRHPSSPVLMLLLTRPDNYRLALKTFHGDAQQEYSGIYLRLQRILIVDLVTGEGALAHELTHALAHADAPHLPEWFDEGLASLHEECEFTQDGLRLVGQRNWRERLLFEAERAESLPLLEEITQRPFGRGSHAGLDYSWSRYFCLFLQERGLLAHYYRKLRQQTNDPDGLLTLSQVFGGQSPEQIDQQFVAWIKKLAERS